MKLIKLFLLCLLPIFGNTEEKFLLIMGPSGVGKSSVIKALKALDSRFTYIKPYTTRPLREGEEDKIQLSIEEIKELEYDHRLLAVNHLYGNTYATPLDPVLEAFETNHFPLIDWPVQKTSLLKEKLSGKIYTVYLYPESLDELFQRLTLDGRDPKNIRYQKGFDELEKFFQGEYDQNIDYKMMSKTNCIDEMALAIYENYLTSREF